MLAELGMLSLTFSEHQHYLLADNKQVIHPKIFRNLYITLVHANEKFVFLDRATKTGKMK